MRDIPEFVLRRREELIRIAAKYGVKDLRFRNYEPYNNEDFEAQFIEFYVNMDLEEHIYSLILEIEECLRMRTYLTDLNGLYPDFKEVLQENSVSL
jgi:hypothetical protein